MSSFDAIAARLGLRHPIIQAPMAGVSTPRMAAEVANAGGLGSLGIGASTAAQARQMIEETRALTSGPVNVNVFCHRPARRDAARESGWLTYLAPLFAEAGAQPPQALDEIYQSFLCDPDAFDLLLALRPAVVSFHFGLPQADRILAFRQAGIVTMATATSLEEARVIEAAGIDMIVAQGIEAGGHRGVFDTDARDERLSTAVLVRLLAGKTRLPIVAAGGIMDGQGIRAMLELGACAAQLGTAFILCPESSANAAYRANMKSCRAGATRLTSAFSGRPARGLVNRLMNYAEAAGSLALPDYPVLYDATKQLNATAAKHGGRHDFAVQWAGQGAPLVREMPAGELLRALVEEMR
jgi:nitronate monooxygenase